MTKIRTIIVDDEPLARDKLRGFLEKEDDVDVVAECGDGKNALIEIEKLRPDLVFLDVQMPELDGFGVIENLDIDPMPKVVFTTAFDEYALRAFDVHAVDYLLKPFDRERFRTALGLVREASNHQRVESMREELESMLAALDQHRAKIHDRVVIKSSGRVVFLKVDDIDWIDAAGNYVRIHAKSESHLLRETMSRLESKLDSSRFLRIHRSTIVNIERIKELQQQFHGDYLVVLHSGQRLTLSRSYRDKLQELVGNAL